MWSLRCLRCTAWHLLYPETPRRKGEFEGQTGTPWPPSSAGSFPNLWEPRRPGPRLLGGGLPHPVANLSLPGSEGPRPPAVTPAPGQVLGPAVGTGPAGCSFLPPDGPQSWTGLPGALSPRARAVLVQGQRSRPLLASLRCLRGQPGCTPLPPLPSTGLGAWPSRITPRKSPWGRASGDLPHQDPSSPLCPPGDPA